MFDESQNKRVINSNENSGQSLLTFANHTDGHSDLNDPLKSGMIKNYFFAIFYIPGHVYSCLRLKTSYLSLTN